MPSPSLIPIAPIIIVTLTTVTICNRYIKLHLREGGYQTLDGLRGLMAFCVFLHHTSIYYDISNKNASWSIPTSNVYEQFGPTSVFVFFMITSFLFYSKILAYKNRLLDWSKFFMGRILRIYPLYFFAMVILFIIVGVRSKWTLHEPIHQVFTECSKWLLFMEPDINGLRYTLFIIVGVVWSLSYEWMFYCLLPSIGVFLNIRASIITLAESATIMIIFISIGLLEEMNRFLLVNSPFLVGNISSFIIQK